MTAKTVTNAKANNTNWLFVYRVSLWVAGFAILIIFSPLWKSIPSLNQPLLLAIPVFLAAISKEWLLGLLLTVVRGTGYFGMAPKGIEMLWITFTLLIIFSWGIYTFFFDSKRFLKIKRK
ncbi:hypothetical protein OSSY52_22580 [Tepiditoga spiralis]|uniref:Uncharacterized protein n=1 Tax=Tepiditoga spiralis TaxID=2108365 RepID=A0A7G1GAF9_9BACT|nr:hypothetical protein [Tepiditoga spiralis]BBE32117.1 hypothetical protein OSSY52_22580 [Tepiditoga spiralis]